MMSNPVKPELIDRLVCAKYIFQQGIQLLDKSSPYAAGIACLHFQDSAEMVLRIIAEHIEADIKKSIAFDQIINKINDKAKENSISPLSHRSALNQLNNARVGFKHFGNQPELASVKKFRNDLLAFLPTALQNFLNIDYETITLAGLVKHQRVKNWLLKAENHLLAEEYPEACACSSISFGLFRHYWYKSAADHFKAREFRDLVDREINSRNSGLRSRGEQTAKESFNKLRQGISAFASGIDTRLTQMQESINLLYDGIDPISYRKFSRYTPQILLSMANTISSPVFTDDGKLTKSEVERLPKITPEIATFCYQFTIDSILQLQNGQPPAPLYAYQNKEVHFVTKQETPIIVHPESKEIIRVAATGERIKSWQHIANKSNGRYKAIVQDGEIAYIAENTLSANPIDDTENS